MTDIPKVGDPLSVDDFDMMMKAFADRRKNFPDEPPIMALGVIIFNIGDRFAPVTCMELEWSGLKKDITIYDGVPRCPNGHVLTQGKGLTLGWVSEE